MQRNISSPIPTSEPEAVRVEVHEQRADEDTCVLSIRGEVDLASAPRLKQELAALVSGTPQRDIVLELSQLAHLDSTGLAVLVGFRRRLAPDQRLVIAEPSSNVTRILTLTGLLSTFDTFATVDDAVVYLHETRQPGPELPLSPEAALVLGLAETALPFADSFAAEARCWQRILLPHGMRGLADDEAGLSHDRHRRKSAPGAPSAEDGRGGQAQRLDRVIGCAARAAEARGACAIRTGDVLRGVVSIYGSLFDEAAANSHDSDTR